MMPSGGEWDFMIGSVGGNVGKPMVFTGYANDDQSERIKAVQFSMDDGETWTTYSTPNAVPDKDLYWRFEYTPEVPGIYQLLIRSVNEHDVPSLMPARVNFWVA